MRTLIAVLVFAIAAAADAQVSARQGETERVRFDSPMILDLPLMVTNSQLWDKGWVRAESELALRKYSCEGVSFIDFSTNAKRQRDGNVKVTFGFVLATAAGVDKLASVTMAIMEGEREIATGARNKIDAEESRQTSGEVVVSISEEELTAKPARTLRITLKVVDNP